MYGFASAYTERALIRKFSFAVCIAFTNEKEVFFLLIIICVKVNAVLVNYQNTGKYITAFNRIIISVADNGRRPFFPVFNIIIGGNLNHIVSAYLIPPPDFFITGAILIPANGIVDINALDIFIRKIN